MPKLTRIVAKQGLVQTAVRERFPRHVPYAYNRGLLTVAEAFYTRAKSKWTRTSKIALICTISVPSRKNALSSVENKQNRSFLYNFRAKPKKRP